MMSKQSPPIKWGMAHIDLMEEEESWGEGVRTELAFRLTCNGRVPLRPLGILVMSEPGPVHTYKVEGTLKTT